MASTKRENPATDEGEDEQPQAKRLKNPSDDSSDSHGNLRVTLNPADCDLAFNIEGDGLAGHALYEKGFAYCWSGARANVGITRGKYCFGCKIVSGQPVEMEDTPPDQQNVCRIGISRGNDPVGNLGETEHSYGFGGTGKFSNAGRFVDYGERFGIGDTIVCLVDLESKPYGSIEFSKNGKRLGIAKHFVAAIDSPGRKLPWELAFFPHILLKNTVVEMQFSLDDGLVPEEGYKPWTYAGKDEQAIIGPSFADPTECEVIMMVGLPASGKTTWAEKWIKEHPEKCYILLGTNLALDQMKVPGLLRKHNYGERFDRLMDRATDIFYTLLSRASKVPRNYIIDQTNVYKSARKRKLKPFAFYHKIAVVVFPRSEQLKFRAEKRFKEMGKEVPPEAVNEMLANFVLPMSKDMRGTDEYFDKIIFTDLNRDEAQRHLEEMKHALALSSSDKSGNYYSPYSRESSVHSESGMPAYSLPGPRHVYSGYSGSSLEVGGVAPGGPRTSHSELAVQPYSANVSTGYTGYGQPGRVEEFQPYHANVNTTYERPLHPRGVEPWSGSLQGSSNTRPARDAYLGMYTTPSNPVPGRGLTPYGGYAHDPYSRQEPYSAPSGYVDNPDSAGSAYQSSYGLPHGAPNPSLHGHPSPSPYGRPNQSPYGHLNPTLHGTPAPSPYRSYPANVRPPGNESYGPSRYY